MELLTTVKSYLSFIPFLSSNKAKPEYFFNLTITPSEITSTVWWIENHKIKTLEPVTKVYINEADLVRIANQCLDESLADFPHEPKRIIFGVPSHWSDEDNLKPEYLRILKAMGHEFQLSPLAFVTISHAMSHYLHQSEGMPGNCVLVGLGDFVEISILKNGRVLDSRIDKKTGHLFEDIQKLLLQFEEVEVLPSKMLFYATKSVEDLSKLKDEMISYPWMEKLSFLHFPKIEIMDQSIANQATIFAGGYEVDPEVKLAGSFQIQESGETALSGIYPTAMTTASTLPVNPTEALGKIEHWVNKFTNKLHLPKLANIRSSKRLIVIPLVLVILLVGYLLTVKAEVRVFVEPRVLEKDTEVTADPKASKVDESKKVIPGKVVDTTVSGSDKAGATGTKLIGNPAKGKILIYNLTSAQVNLASGAVLTSSNGLKFALDTSVKIASQSSTVGSDFTTVIKPGKSDPVGVTASEIGPDSNLPAGGELMVNGYQKSAVVAKIDEALSGGTSKSVTVVTSDDQKKLQAKLLSDLRVKAQESIQAKLTGDQKIIAESLQVADGKYNFNKGINDQANELLLNANVHFKGTAYSDNDLKSIVAKLVETSDIDGFKLSLDESETSAGVAKIEKDGKLIFLARFKAKLLPKIEDNVIKDKIRARPTFLAISSLKELDHVLGGEVIYNPRFPAQFGLLPLLNRNITISLTSK